MARYIHFSCSSCGKTLKAKPELAGKKARCACGQTVEILSRESPATPATSTAASGPQTKPQPQDLPAKCYGSWAELGADKPIHRPFWQSGTKFGP